MIDKTRKNAGLTRQELINEMRADDLVAIVGQLGKVHIVFPGTGSICKPARLEVGTRRRNERRWDILGTSSFEKFKTDVMRELGRESCKDCLALYE